EALRQRQIPVVGVLLNGPAHANNLSTLEQLGGVPMLGCLSPLAAINAETLREQWQELELSHKLQT
ncbi:MAG: dethiobiotin synthase, partial [Cyanobacteriota bacterium]